MKDRQGSTSSRLRLVGVSASTGIAGKLVQFLALTLVALTLHQDDYGRLAIVQALVLGVSSIASSSFAFASNKAAAALAVQGTVHDLPGALVVVLRNRFLSFAIVALVNAVLIPVLYAVISGAWIPAELLPIGALSAAVVIVDAAVGAVAGFGRYKTSSAVDGLRAATAGAATILLALPFGLIGAAYGLVLVDVGCAVVVLAYVAVHRRASRLLHIRAEMHGRVTASGLASNSLAQLGNWLLLFIVQATGGLAGVGSYSIANRFASLVLLATGYINRNMLGDIARVVERGGHGGTRSALRFYLTVVFGIAVVASVVALVALPVVFPEVADSYPEAAPILAVLLVATIVRACATCLGIVCVAFSYLRVWISSDVSGFVALGGALIVTLVVDPTLPWIAASLVFSNFAVLAHRWIALSRKQWRPASDGREDIDVSVQ